MGLENLFDEGARARIAEAVKSAEARSEGQIVPVVVERSDSFSEARYRGALAGVLLATGVVLLFWGWVHPWELALVQVGAWLMGWGVSAWDPIERRLVGRKVLAEAARARAVRAFHEHNLHRTAAGTGVLIFASLFEHEVVVLGDRGIDAQMGPEGWKHAVDALVRALRASRPAEGFVEAIAQCGEVLARHFPRAGGTGPNELDDRLRMDKSL